MICHQCGTQVPEGMEFCTNCGTRIEPESILAQPIHTTMSATPILVLGILAIVFGDLGSASLFGLSALRSLRYAYYSDVVIAGLVLHGVFTLFGIAAIILGIIGISKAGRYNTIMGPQNGKVKAGKVLSVIGMILGFVSIFSFIIALIIVLS